MSDDMITEDFQDALIAITAMAEKSQYAQAELERLRAELKVREANYLWKDNKILSERLNKLEVSSLALRAENEELKSIIGKAEAKIDLVRELQRGK